MFTYVVVSVVGGILVIMDGVMNANPMAQRLNEVYKPIARTSLNIVAGVAIDLAYGFIMAAVFFNSLHEPARRKWHSEKG